MSEIVLCCGKVCAGKSIFSRFLEDRYSFYHFSADTWMLHFYEETSDRKLFDLRLQKCISMINSLADRILFHGSDVVLDFGYWKHSDRLLAMDHYQSLGHKTNVVYFPIDIDTQIKHMNARQKSRIDQDYKFDRRTVEALNEYFEEPNQDEETLTREEYLKIIGKMRLASVPGSL